MAVLRKLKEKLSRAARGKTRTTAAAARSATAKSPRARKETVILQPDVPRKDVLGAQEVAVERTKFSHPEVARPRRMLPEDLPYHYDRDKIVLLVRDPWWLYSYWDVRDATVGRFTHEIGDDFHNARRILRIYDVTDIIFNGSNAHRFFDIYINEHVRTWYIDTAEPGRSWCVDYGLLLADGRFIMIMRSNVAQTPPAGPSAITDEEWMVPEEIFARLYGLGFGLGRSSPVGKAWQERMQKALFSGVLSSPGLSSGASPVKPLPRGRAFRLVVDCELIVYGATEPDAKVSAQGRPIKLRKDGTFTLRFALPDGRQDISVKAVSADEAEERTITPIVTRATEASVVVKDG